MSEHIGKQFGNYRLTQLLGRGGFADTYLGEQIYLKTYAAIKVLQAQLAHEDQDSFFNEARTIARLRHRNIVRVLEFGVEGTIPYLVMDYAPNGTLRRRHPRGIPLPPEVIVPYVKQVAEGLQFAHDQKVIHRDVKPENMLLGQGQEMEVLLSDFGIAVIALNTRAEGLQDVAGTMTYMAPEQIQGRPRPASDQYALGVVVYEWLCGVVPFSGTYTEVAIQHERNNPVPLRERVPTLSQDIEHVVMTSLSKDPARRFGSVRAFANALEQATADARPQNSQKFVSGSDSQVFMATEIASYVPQPPEPASAPPPVQQPQTAYGYQPPSGPYGAQPTPSGQYGAQPTPSGQYGAQPTPSGSQSPFLATNPPGPYSSQPTPSGGQNLYGTIPAPTGQEVYGAQQTPPNQNPYGPLSTPSGRLPSGSQATPNEPSFYGSPTAQPAYGQAQPQAPSNPNLYGAVPQPGNAPQGPVSQGGFGTQYAGSPSGPQGATPAYTPVHSQQYQPMVSAMGMPVTGVRPPQERPGRRLPVSRNLLIAGLVFLLIGGSVLIFFAAIYVPNQQHMQATNTAVANVTDTAHANGTATGVVNATATGIVNATASAVASATAYPTNLFTQSSTGNPTLSDPLTTADGNGWDHFTNTDGGCEFKDGGYHATTVANFYTPCFAKIASYKDFAFEVEMTMLTGHYGGLIFHADSNGSGYYFRIGTDNTYRLYGNTVDTQGNSTTKDLITGSADSIKPGGNPNTLGVVYKGGDMFVYINGVFVNRINDTTYGPGKIGIFVDSDTGGGEAVFRNLKVWQL